MATPLTAMTDHLALANVKQGLKTMDDNRINILLVDDQPAKLLSYEVMLQELGETLVKANSARAAFEHLLKKDIAVILIDVCMPELDGLELATMIRNHPRFETTAIIFVSAIALTDLDYLKGYQRGAVDYVSVPVVPDVLRAKVRVFAELFRKTRQLRTLNDELERRVEERTAELACTNAELERRVEARTLEREAALAQLHEMQKLESLGKITGNLAHDFNNLLMAIIGNLDLLKRKLPRNPALQRLVDGSLEAAERGAGLTSRLLAFARRQDLRPEPVDISRLINGMKEMLIKVLGPAINLNLDFEPDLAMVLMDPNQLELALFNLALNGRDAMPQGGELTIRCRLRTVERGNVSGLRPGDYVGIGVIDTGIGMSGPTLSRATEPYFTTKEMGRGNGLGLSMVYGLATQSGGQLNIESEVAVGTQVELLLPVAAEQNLKIEKSADLPVSPAVATKSYRVLLVDDDRMAGDATLEMLSELGHSVILARSGMQALELLGKQPPLDIMITDHAMPGMTGVELAKEVKRLRPGLPVLLATGYADSSNGETLGLPRLDKPYRLAKLTTMIDSLVGVTRDEAGSAVGERKRH
jgi:signal transduction histidine kinase